MRKAESLLRHFEREDIEVRRIGKNVYYGEGELPEKNLFGIGIYIGDEKKDFAPSPGILELIKNTTKAVQLNEKASWLFICGRDAFADNIKNPKTGTVLVKNERGEPIGIGELSIQKGKPFLKNKMDLGSFLRREKN